VSQLYLAVEHGSGLVRLAGETVVGRGADADLPTNDAMTSARHCVVRPDGRGATVEDLGSTNGTLLDGAPIDRERIESGDEITFGQTSARFVRRSGAPGGAPGEPQGRR